MKKVYAIALIMSLCVTSLPQTVGMRVQASEIENVESLEGTDESAVAGNDGIGEDTTVSDNGTVDNAVSENAAVSSKGAEEDVAVSDIDSSENGASSDNSADTAASDIAVSSNSDAAEDTAVSDNGADEDAAVSSNEAGESAAVSSNGEDTDAAVSSNDSDEDVSESGESTDEDDAGSFEDTDADATETSEVADATETGEVADATETGEVADAADKKNVADKKNAAGKLKPDTKKNLADLKSPEFSYETDVDGYHFTISADKNVVPEGAKVYVKRLTGAKERRASEDIREEADETLLSAVSFDITIRDAEGNEFQPEDGDAVRIDVRLSSEEAENKYLLGDSVKFGVFHKHDNDAVEELDTAEDIGVSDETIDVTAEPEADNVIDEEFIDTDTMTLKSDELTNGFTPMMAAVTMGTESTETGTVEENLPEITLSCDTDSFSTFTVAILNAYDLTPYTLQDGYIKTINIPLGMAKQDFTGVTQSALNEAINDDSGNRYNVVVPAGYYNLTNTLNIGSNTTLRLSGVTIKTNFNGTAIFQSKVKDGAGQYSDYSNIAILGGTIDNSATTFTPLRFAHMTGLTIRDMKVVNTLGKHMIELAACKDVVIAGCSFENMLDESNSAEAIELDFASKGGFRYVQDPVYDDWGNSNVEISSCTFKNVLNGIGTHHIVYGNFYQSDINVHDCYFEDIKRMCVEAPAWVNASITNNRMINVGRGVDSTLYYWEAVYPTNLTYTDVSAFERCGNFTISGNTITLGGSDRNSSILSGIIVGGYSIDGDTTYINGRYLPSNYTITGNTITGFADYDHYDSENLYTDIYVFAVRNVNIYSNTIKNGDYGILVQSGSAVNDIKDNKLSKMQLSNLMVKDGASVVNFAGTKLSMDARCGICVDSSSSCGGSCTVAGFKIAAGESSTVKNSEYKIFTTDLSDVKYGTYSTDKKDIATITKKGVLKTKKKGKVGVTLSWAAGNGQSTMNVTMTVDVKKAPTKVKLGKKKTISLKKGKTYQLKPTVNTLCSTYKYKSSNKKIAKVSKTGLIKAVKKGTAVITVTTYNGKKATIKVKVK